MIPNSTKHLITEELEEASVFDLSKKATVSSRVMENGEKKYLALQHQQQQHFSKATNTMEEENEENHLFYTPLNRNIEGLLFSK